MSRWAALFSLLLFVIVALVGIDASLRRSIALGDFRAFYCAGQLSRERAFSYTESAIAPCESQSSHQGLFTARPSLIVPAPLPGYLVLLFVPISKALFPQACAGWLLVLFACGIATALCIARLGWVRFDVAVIALAVPVGIVCMPPGELPPISLLGIALLLLGLEHDWLRLRAIGLLLAFAEPQIALVLCVALFAVKPRAWREITGVIALLALLSVLAIGVSQNVLYITQVLPAHVTAEVFRAQQYTVSWMATQLGASVFGAQWIGRLAYAISIAAAYWLARALSRYGEGTGAVALAAPLALLGGPFVHADHLLCALPAAFWLASRGRAGGVIAVLLLALPIAAILALPVLVGTFALVTWWVVRGYGASGRFSAYAGLVAVCIAAGLAVLSSRIGFSLVTAVQSEGGAWAQYVATHNVVRGGLIWVIKAPVWIALALLVIGGTGEVHRFARGIEG